MDIRTHFLLTPTPGTQRQLQSLHFGPGGGPKAYIQAALHADEIPPLLVAHHLRQRLSALEAEGRLRGEVVLVPMANPIGLSQWPQQQLHGRFETISGENFNRHYPDVLDEVVDRVVGRLGDDAATNVALVRAALREAVSDTGVETELQSLRKTLLGLAIDADVVLDLHCDFEAALHLYTGTDLWPQAEPLARLMGAQAVLLANESGDHPFDEACSMPWPRLAARLSAEQALPLACLAVTVELRGEIDVDHALAEQDAQAIVDFLAYRGIVAGGAPQLPAARCQATPLAGSLPVIAARAGVLVYQRNVGDKVARGDVIAELVDPVSGEVLPLTSPTDGLLYARQYRRFAVAGARVARVAGREAVRSGKLLSP